MDSHSDELMYSGNSKKKHVNKKENNGKIKPTKNAKENKRNDGNQLPTKKTYRLICIEQFTKSHCGK